MPTAELSSGVITPELLKTLREEYLLDWDGIHGYPHWVRVRENGLCLAELTGANTVVVELFAFLHDICRRNDDADSGHGQRAAEYAAELPYVRSVLSRAEFSLLTHACADHTSGCTQADLTVQVCWDADRLDLGRIGIRPDPPAPVHGCSPPAGNHRVGLSAQPGCMSSPCNDPVL
jgi:uncharacterized protein